jgi:hypothetical protein
MAAHLWPLALMAGAIAVVVGIFFWRRAHFKKGN